MCPFIGIEQLSVMKLDNWKTCCICPFIGIEQQNQF